MIPKREIKLFIIVWGVFLAIISICLSAFTISKIVNERKLVEAQIEQLGKPIIYEQHYFSPNEKSN